MKYKAWYQKYKKCIDERERKKLSIILSDMLEYDNKKTGDSYYTILKREDISLIDLPKWFQLSRRKFARTTQPLKWRAGLIKPKGKLRLTKKIAWIFQEKKVFFSPYNEKILILGKKKALLVGEDDLPRLIGKIYNKRASRKIKEQNQRRLKKAKIISIDSIIDSILPTGKCRGEPKRLKKCWR